MCRDSVHWPTVFDAAKSIPLKKGFCMIPIIQFVALCLVYVTGGAGTEHVVQSHINAVGGQDAIEEIEDDSTDRQGHARNGIRCL